MNTTHLEQLPPPEQTKEKARQEAGYYDEGIGALQGCLLALLVTSIMWAGMIVAVWQMVGGGR